MKTLKELLASKDITMEAFKGMEPEGQAAIYNELNDINKAAFKALSESSEATKEELEAFKTQMSEERNEQFKALNNVLKEHGMAIKKLSEKEQSNTDGVFSSIRKALEDGAKKIESIKRIDRRTKIEEM